LAQTETEMSCLRSRQIPPQFYCPLHPTALLKRSGSTQMRSSFIKH
jgi:hypothetical protein